jgi:hypothetical protein
MDIQEELSEWLLTWKCSDSQEKAEEDAAGIISLFKRRNFVQLAKDQSLPENPYKYDIVSRLAYAEVQDSMLNAGFRKVEPIVEVQP